MKNINFFLIVLKNIWLLWVLVAAWGSLVLACELLAAARGISFPD